MKIYYCAVAVIFFTVLSCQTQEQKDERLAKQYCGSCHLFPEPEMLDKKTWDKKVFPEMAFLMGLDNSKLMTIPPDDQSAVISALPASPMIGEEQWEAIKRYYQANAPDTLITPRVKIDHTIDQFDATSYGLPSASSAITTLIRSDTLHNKIYVGTRKGKLYQFNTEMMMEDSFRLKSAPSQMLTRNSENPLLLGMGIMDPSEQAQGELINFNLKEGTSLPIIDSLQRPVNFESADFNNDGDMDYVICTFGNYTGALLAFESQGNGNFKKHILQNSPGARKVIIGDFDNNGLKDILALITQGDERIIMLYNQGNFDFRIVTLLLFKPLFGSSYFDIADFNNDGNFDILYTNGDNADFSPILKPYHGVRIFLNNGSNDFKESWFYPMHGASQARTNDFDKDGDLDIAVISFFPDFGGHPEQGFIYFENTPTGFIPQITPIASSGRWITMEMSDFDKDGDSDLFLGALNFAAGVPKTLLEDWKKGKNSIILLRNKLH